MKELNYLNSLKEIYMKVFLSSVLPSQETELKLPNISTPLPLGSEIDISNDVYMQILNIQEPNELGLMCRKYDIRVISMKSKQNETRITTNTEKNVDKEERIAKSILRETEYVVSIFNIISSQIECDDTSIMNATLAVYDNISESVIKGDMDEPTK